jgi:hypothetical protein
MTLSLASKISQREKYNDTKEGYRWSLNFDGKYDSF